jgi:hypothetical protein
LSPASLSGEQAFPEAARHRRQLGDRLSFFDPVGVKGSFLPAVVTSCGLVVAR